MAKTAQHEPGEHSINEVNVVKHGDAWVIRWRWWPYDRTKAQSFRHQGRTKGEARAKALAKAAELEAGTGRSGKWSKASKIADYIEQVSRPAVTDSSKLGEDTKSLYERALTLLAAEFGQRVIATAAEEDAAVGVIESIARDHGAQTGRTARSVASKWVFARLKRSKIIAANPLVDAEIDYGTVKKSTKTSNDVALGEPDYDRLLDHLLAIDTDTIKLPPRSRPETRAKLRVTIDATLLQMTTGMRLGTVRQVEPHEIIDNKEGGINLAMPAPKIKGKKRGVTWTVLDDRVAKRVRAMRDATPAGSYVFGAPADTSKVWDRRNATRAIAALYMSLAEELEIKELERDIRSHGWRTTLNTIYYWLPPHVRAEWFGHSESVNAAHYVAAEMDLSPMFAAAKERRRQREAAEAQDDETDDIGGDTL